jgi:hypothetical protein
LVEFANFIYTINSKTLFQEKNCNIIQVLFGYETNNQLNEYDREFIRLFRLFIFEKKFDSNAEKYFDKIVSTIEEYKDSKRFGPNIDRFYKETYGLFTVKSGSS